MNTNTNPFDADTVKHEVSQSALLLMVNIIQLASKAGAFDANDLIHAGQLFEYLRPFVATAEQNTTQTN